MYRFLKFRIFIEMNSGGILPSVKYEFGEGKGEMQLSSKTNKILWVLWNVLCSPSTSSGNGASRLQGEAYENPQS